MGTFTVVVVVVVSGFGFVSVVVDVGFFVVVVEVSILQSLGFSTVQNFLSPSKYCPVGQVFSIPSKVTP